MTKENNSIINALKRLERVGDENSRVTQKLKEACFILAKQISENVPSRVGLPRGYFVETYTTNTSPSDTFDYQLLKRYFDDDSKRLEIDYKTIIDFEDETTSRTACLEFAADIADGLLTEIADWLEARKAESEKAITVVETAQEGIK